jgi:hypothetical protein
MESGHFGIIDPAQLSGSVTFLSTTKSAAIIPEEPLWSLADGLF